MFRNPYFATGVRFRVGKPGQENFLAGGNHFHQQALAGGGRIEPGPGQAGVDGKGNAQGADAYGVGFGQATRTDGNPILHKPAAGVVFPNRRRAAVADQEIAVIQELDALGFAQPRHKGGQEHTIGVVPLDGTAAPVHDQQVTGVFEPDVGGAHQVGSHKQALIDAIGIEFAHVPGVERSHVEVALAIPVHANAVADTDCGELVDEIPVQVITPDAPVAGPLEHIQQFVGADLDPGGLTDSGGEVIDERTRGRIMPGNPITAQAGNQRHALVFQEQDVLRPIQPGAHEHLGVIPVHVVLEDLPGWSPVRPDVNDIQLKILGRGVEGHEPQNEGKYPSGHDAGLAGGRESNH